LYADALLTPAFDAREFDRIRQDQLTAIRANESDPDFSIDRMAKQTAFAGKNYSKDPFGTIETVTPLTAADLKNYYKSLLTRNRLVIVIVGDIEKSTLENKIKNLLAGVPAGSAFIPKKETYAPAANTFKPQGRENATNYVQGISGAPQTGTPDFNAYILALRIFSNRHFIEIRTKNGLSYAPGVWFTQGLTPYSNIYVTTTDPDKYIAVARQLIEKVKKEGFTAEELKNTKTQYLTNVYSRQETNDAQAGSLAFNEVVHGNWRRANQIKDDIKKVTLPQLNAAFNRYFTNITWSYQGNPAKVTSVLFTQKQIPQVPAEKKGF
jgi:predicted Zn-dependent peptidase